MEFLQLPCVQGAAAASAELVLPKMQVCVMLPGVRTSAVIMPTADLAIVVAGVGRSSAAREAACAAAGALAHGAHRAAVGARGAADLAETRARWSRLKVCCRRVAVLAAQPVRDGDPSRLAGLRHL